MNPIIEVVRQDLITQSNEKTKQSTLRFFKEEITCYGVKSDITRQIGKSYYKQIKHVSKADIFNLCDELWKSGNLEESFIACHWSHAISKQFVPKDFKQLEQWVKNHITNWASCDTFCNHTVGDFIEMYPTFLSELKKWTQSPNRWVRRAAAVSLIVPAKKGLFLNDVFEIATMLLTDNDDMVQKGYGWMLKVASQAHQQKVFNFVVANKAAMPRTALRYAIEKMPATMKKIAMSK